MRKLFAVILAAASPLIASAAYPDRPIKMIVPWAAGGDTDNIFRPFAPLLQKHIGQTVVIANVGGASTSAGAACELRRERAPRQRRPAEDERPAEGNGRVGRDLSGVGARAGLYPAILRPKIESAPIERMPVRRGNHRRSIPVRASGRQTQQQAGCARQAECAAVDVARAGLDGSLVAFVECFEEAIAHRGRWLAPGDGGDVEHRFSFVAVPGRHRMA